MNHDSNQHDKELVLRSVMGGDLTADESARLGAFLETAEGAQYRQEVNHMKTSISELRDPEVRSVDRAAMMEQFETKLREESGGLFEGNRYRNLCLSIMAFTTIFVPVILYLPHPSHGLSERLQGILLLYAMMAAFCAYIGYGARQRLSDESIFLTEKREAQRYRRPSTWISLMLCAAWAAWAIGVVEAVAGTAVLIGVSVWFRHLVRKARREQDLELWGWFEEEVGA